MPSTRLSSLPARVFLFGLLFAVLCWGGIGAARVQAQPVTTAVPFLLIKPDARAAAMGNTGVALANNANAVYWNPAGLAFQEHPSGSLTHTNWLPEFGADLALEYLMAAYPVEGVGTFGAHVTYFNLGEYEIRNENGEFRGTFKAYEVAFGVSYGRKVSDHFALGVGLRGIVSSLADQLGGSQSVEVHPAKTFAFDLAGLYRTDPFDLGGVPTSFSAGFNLSNMGPGVSYIENDSLSASDPIPTTLRVGYAFTFEFNEYNSLTITNDFSKLLVKKELTVVDGDSLYQPAPFYQSIFTSWQSLDTLPDKPGDELGLLEQIMVGVGLEYWYNDLFALRTGYYYEAPDNGDRQFLSFGAGIRYNIFGVDLSYIYALEEESPLTNTLRVSLVLNLKR